MNISLALALGLLLAADSLSAAEPLTVAKVEPAAEWNALFTRTNGWIGGDGAYSVTLSPERTVWLFSDSWIGRVEHGRRTNAVLVNNSVGVQTGRGADARMEFYHGQATSGKPAAFLTPADGRGWFWLYAGAHEGGRLFLFLWQMDRQQKARGTAAFNFRPIGNWLGVVENPLDSPSQWRVTQTRLPFAQADDKRHLLFGSAVLRVGRQLYIYGVDERPGSRSFTKGLVLARVDAGALADFAAWHFYRDGEWVADARESGAVGRIGGTELSVSFQPALGRYVLVASGDVLAPTLTLATAPEPWGPWTKPAVFYRCPEAEWSKEVFCYAGKGHVALSANNELLVSYAANAHSLAGVLRDARLYWPRFVRVTFSEGGTKR